MSHRGASGGYTLARSPSAISVAEVIAALEGPIAVTECIDETHSDCAVESVCRVRTNWQRINDAVRGALEQVTLAEMAQPFDGSPPPARRPKRSWCRCAVACERRRLALALAVPRARFP